MKKLLVTLDYELYGNGSGDVFKHIIEPTESILAVCNQKNVKVTIFFEVVEYWMLKNEWEKGNTMGYAKNPVEAMENQIIAAYQQGHDVQLHIHPQWVNAVYENGRWNVDFNAWRLGGYKDEGENSIYYLLKKGKETLESIINHPSYQCTALRAGGYNIQPSREVLNAMCELGLRIDSSVYSGGKETGVLSQYDYSKITNEKGYWYIDKDVLIDEGKKTTLIELPIVAFPLKRIFKFLTIERVKSIFKNRQSAMNSFEAKTSKSSKLTIIKYFFQYEWQTWDYCLFSNRLHRQYIKKCNELYQQNKRDYFVVIGHPKNLVTTKTLEFLLYHAQQNKYNFQSIKQLDII